MDWASSYTCSYRVHRVSPGTWDDGDPVDGLRELKVTRDSSGDLIESATATFEGAAPEGGYLRVVLVAESGSGAERHECCTMLFSEASAEYGRGTVSESMEGRSVLYPASVRVVDDGSWVPAGTDACEAAAKMLRECIAAPVESVPGAKLTGDYVYEFGATVLEAVWGLLESAGACIRIDGHGTVTVQPLPTEPALVLDSDSTRLLFPGVKVTRGVAEVPNRYIAVGEQDTAVAVNDDPGSPVSTVSRGWAHDELDEDPAPMDGEDLAAYARRRLAELSTVAVEAVYEREYAPSVRPYDVVRGSLASCGLDGDMRVESQELDFGHGIHVTEKSVKEVELWTA